MLCVVGTLNLTIYCILCFSFLVIGIRGALVLPVVSCNTSKVSRPTNNTPRYQFNNEEPSTSKKNSMGPPLGVPLIAKRRLVKTADINYNCEQDLLNCP